MDDLAKLKEAAEKADPSLTRGASEAQVEKIIRAGMATVPYSGKADYAADAAYIVAACRAVPGLLTRLSAANARADAAEARAGRMEGALREAREDILSFVHARWSEAEGSDEDHVGYIDAALRTEGEGHD